MSDFTPTTEQVRDGYASDPEIDYRDPISYPTYERGLKQAFDRWLAQVKAEAWDEGHCTRQKREPDACECGAWNVGECACGLYGTGKIITPNP